LAIALWNAIIAELHKNPVNDPTALMQMKHGGITNEARNQAPIMFQDAARKALRP